LSLIEKLALLTSYYQLKMAKSYENGQNWVFKLALSLSHNFLKENSPLQQNLAWCVV